MYVPCGICKETYPFYLVQWLVTSEGRVDSCPLCALEARNKMAGLPLDTPFHGEMALEMWEEASAIRKERKR